MPLTAPLYTRRGALRALVGAGVGGLFAAGGEAASGAYGAAGAAKPAGTAGAAASEAGTGSRVLWTPLQHRGRDYLPLDQVGRFYGFGAVQRSGNGFVLGAGNRSLRGQADSPDFHISRIKFILSYPVAELGGILCLSRVDLVKLLEPVLRPSKIEGAARVNTVVLDPGHGGMDRGALGRLGDEKSFTLDVSLRAAEMLRRSGYKVLLTRAVDEFVSLEDRVNFARRFPSALFVSVHFNAGGAGTGVETYAMSPRGVPSMSSEGSHLPESQEYPGNTRDPENAALATAMHAALVARSGMFDRGIKRARFYVLREASMPGVLLEAGFLSNSEDMLRIAQPAYRQQVAGSIVEAVGTYRRAVGGPGV